MTLSEIALLSLIAKFDAHLLNKKVLMDKNAKDNGQYHCAKIRAMLGLKVRRAEYRYAVQRRINGSSTRMLLLATFIRLVDTKLLLVFGIGHSNPVGTTHVCNPMYEPVNKQLFFLSLFSLFCVSQACC